MTQTRRDSSVGGPRLDLWRSRARYGSRVRFGSMAFVKKLLTYYCDFRRYSLEQNVKSSAEF